MGLFGGKKTYVSSVLYNLAGPPEERASYLKSLVVGNVIGRSRFSMGEVIRDGYRSGPYQRLKSFFRWAETNYGTVGVPAGTLGGGIDLDLAVIQQQIPHGAGESVMLQFAQLAPADYAYWAEQRMIELHPELLDTGWTSDIDEATGEITITFADLSSETFVPAAYDPGKAFIYASYNIRFADGSYGSTRLWIYQVGSGNVAIDTMVRNELDDGEYLPFIPIRIDNQFLSGTNEPTVYEQAKKAYKKATGQKFDELVDKITDNPDLDQIDHAYVAFGVPLNTTSNEGREYLYRFFDKLRLSQTSSNVEFLLWRQNEGYYEGDLADWNEDLAFIDTPLGPMRKPRPRPTNQVRITGTGSFAAKFDMTISWTAIDKTTGSGLKKPDAEPGELWLTVEADPIGSVKKLYVSGNGVDVDRADNTTIAIHWQLTANRWQTLTIHGAVHLNHIYKKKSVIIDAKAALTEEEPGEDSGFLVPIHMDTLAELGIVKANQLMTASAYVVFNCYKVVKKKWYQTGIFKIIVVIAIVVITYYTGGFGASSAGLLGTNAAVGTAIGFTGTAAVIAGAIANAIAAMIVAHLVMQGATALLGDKFGAIVGVIASIATLQIGTALSNGMSMSAMWAQMMQAPNIIAMTSSVGNGVAGYIQASAQQLMGKTQGLLEDYRDQSRRISELFAENIGYDRGVFDPFSLTDTSNALLVGSLAESRGDFLSRTLMTGSDVAEMSLDMLTRFAEHTLSTALPGTTGG